MSIPRLYWRQGLRHLPSSCRKISQAPAVAESGAPARPRAYNINTFAVPELYTKEDDKYIAKNGYHAATEEEKAEDRIDFEKKLYSAKGMRLAWFDYQETLIHKVNQKIAQRGFEGEIKDLVIQSARNPAEASLFNHASQAFNNKFFFDGIRPSVDQPMPETLRKALVRDFGTIDSLRAEMLAMAEAMFGPGYVWLVKKNDKRDGYSSFGSAFKLLATYNAGSPLPGAHYRRQPVDMNTQDVNDAIAAGGVDALSRRHAGNSLPQHREVQNAVGSMGSTSQLQKWPKQAFGGADIVPCLCVSTWEHTYVADFGHRKRQFLDRWWRFINWDHVTKLSGVENDSRLPAARTMLRNFH